MTSDDGHTFMLHVTGGSSITLGPSIFDRLPIRLAIFLNASMAFALLLWPNSARRLSPRWQP